MRTNRIFKGSIWGLALAVASIPFVSFAQSNTASTTQTAQILATVYIANPVTVYTNNKISVFFTIGNGTGAQPDVRYGIQLMKIEANGSQVLADQYVATDTLALTAGQKVQRTITYTPAPNLNGKYQVWVIAQNSSGLPLSAVPSSNIVLAGSKDGYINIASSCTLSVSGDKREYSSYEGVDVLPSETLIATCRVTNNFAHTEIVRPAFETYKRSEFGSPVVMKDTQNTITLLAGKTTDVAFDIPFPLAPQAYDVKLRLVDATTSATVSNTAVFHYVLKGLSGTLQNVALDKNQYKKGDTANVTVSWSQSADIFPHARYASSTASTSNMYIAVAFNNNCANPITQQVDQAGSIVIPIAITTTCNDPSLVVSLKDVNGTVLDQKHITLNTGPKKINQTPLLLTLGVLILLVILFYVVYGLKRKHTVS